MCGFRPAAEISAFCTNVPELRMVVGGEACDKLAAAVAAGSPDDALRAHIRGCFEGLMTRDNATVSAQLASLVARLGKAGGELTPLEVLLLRLDKEFPGGDVGCFCVYFLNVINLAPGEAMFLGPNEPHA
jgi:mannose-6-phosphate isomerase